MKQIWIAGFCAHLLFVVAVAVGAYTGHLPTSLPSFPHFDWLGHAVLIGGLALFLDGALGHRRVLHHLPFLRIAPLLVLFVAAIEEYAQRFSARRSSSFADFAADVIGVCFFTWLSLPMERLLSGAAPTRLRWAPDRVTRTASAGSWLRKPF